MDDKSSATVRAILSSDAMKSIDYKALECGRLDLEVSRHSRLKRYLGFGTANLRYVVVAWLWTSVTNLRGTIPVGSLQSSMRHGSSWGPYWFALPKAGRGCQTIRGELALGDGGDVVGCVLPV